MRNDSETIWNERKNQSQKQRRLDRFHSAESSVEKDQRTASRMAAVGNDREVYDLLFGRPGEYPAMD